MRHIVRVAALALVLAPLAGCGDDADPAAVVPGDGPRDTYTVTVAADDKGTDMQSWTLTCDPSGGTHPEPDKACAALAAADDLFGSVPPDTACTEIYGGSGVATITGTADGTAVDARYSRTNGCEIARWDALGPVLPGPPPGQPSAP